MNKGIVVAYSPDASAGIIQTEDLEPHYFSISHWQANDLEPRVNMKVTFDKHNSGVRNIRLSA